MEPMVISGWFDSKTGEVGKFDKDNKPIPLTLDDKIKNWFKRLFHKNTLVYSGEYVYAGLVSHGGINGVYYLNHEKKLGYMIYLGIKENIDYYAAVKNNSIVKIN